MGFKAALMFVFLFLLSETTVLFSQRAMVKASANVIRVPNDFPTIQEAINAAENGSTILVDSGIYHEHVVLNKTLALIGTEKENTVIYDTRPYSSIFSTDLEAAAIYILADDTVVNGFTIRNGTYGVGVDHCNGSIVSGNIITLNVHGVTLDHSNASAISDNIVTSNLWDGIELANSCNNTVSNNIVSSTWVIVLDGAEGFGIHLSSSVENTINGNIITGSGWFDIFLEDGSNNNTMFENTIGPMGPQESTFGQDLESGRPLSGNNTIFHNNFIARPPSFTVISGPPPFPPFSLPANDVWSMDGEGNYWSDYSGLDDGSGGRAVGDGVGDTDLPWHGADNYPLISPVNPLPILWGNEAFCVSIISNCTVYGDASRPFGFDQSSKNFASMVFGPANTTGYFNLTLPKTLLSGPWEARMDGNVVSARISENQTHTAICLSYSNNGQHSHYILVGGTYVVPEYPSPSTFVLAILLLSMPMIIVAKKKRHVHPALASCDL